MPGPTAGWHSPKREYSVYIRFQPIDPGGGGLESLSRAFAAFNSKTNIRLGGSTDGFENGDTFSGNPYRGFSRELDSNFHCR